MSISLSGSKILGNTTDIKGYHELPAVNSEVYQYIRDVIGTPEDIVQVPYDFGKNSLLAFLITGYYHVHGESFVYPNHANGVTLTAGAGVWDLIGAITEVVPAGGLNTAAFDLHWIDVYDISATGEIQVDLYAGGVGAETLIGAIVTQRTSNFSREGPQPVQIPQQAAGTRISARLSDSTAGQLTCKVKLVGHYYA